MPRPEKVQAVDDIKTRLEGARAVFVAEYSGLSVKAQQELRRGLRAANSEFKVLKMTLARRAASELGHEGLLELLVGPTGLTFAAEDAATTAKVLRDFAKDHQQLVIKGALLGGEVLPPERITELADLEPREVLLAKIAGAFQAPMAKFAGLLAAMPRNLATMVQQLIEKAPAEEAAEPPAEEEAAASPAAEAEEPAAEAAPEEAAAEEAATEEAAAEEAATEDAPVAKAAEEEQAEASAEAESDDETVDEEPADEAEEE